MTTHCRWCHEAEHVGLCPLIRAVEFYPDGVTKRIEFWSRAQLDQMLIAANPAQVFEPKD